MKLMCYCKHSEPVSLASLGVLMENGLVGNLRGGYACSLMEKGDTQGRESASLRIPPNVFSYLHIGPAARHAAAEAKKYLETMLNQICRRLVLMAKSFLSQFRCPTSYPLSS